MIGLVLRRTLRSSGSICAKLLGIDVAWVGLPFHVPIVEEKKL
jgi:hypothetical protein